MTEDARESEAIKRVAAFVAFVRERHAVTVASDMPIMAALDTLLELAKPNDR